MKFTIRKKHYDAAVKAIRKGMLSENCLVAQALKDAYRVNYAQCSQNILRLHSDLVSYRVNRKVQDLISDFDNDQESALAQLPIKVEFPFSQKEVKAVLARED